MSTTTTIEEPSPAARVAVQTAVAALRDRPPQQACPHCRQTAWEHVTAGGRLSWRCSVCFRPGPSTPPTTAEEREAAVQAVKDFQAKEDAETTARLRHQIAVDQRRDRRLMTPALARGMREALLHRANPRYPVTPAAREWLDHCPLLDLCRKHVELTGHPDPFSLSRHEVAMRALVRGVDGWVPASSRASGYLSTSDLPQLLDTTARVLFLDAYADTVRSFAPWTTAVTVADFRSTIVTSAEFPDLLAIEEHGEYVAGNPFGPAVPVRLTKFGRIVQYTEHALLRDDVATFGQLQQALGVAAASVENDAVYDLLTSNPTMADGAPLFTTGRGNLMPAKALDAASLADACAALAANSTHGRPAFLLVGTKDGPTARRLVHEEAGAGDASGALEVVQDDRITGGFYVTCDPGERPTLVTAHLAAADGPELLSRDAWDIDARSYKGRDEFGAAVVDWKSMVFTPATP